jgi:hypothetical protein
MNQVTYPSAQVVKYGFNRRSLLESIKDGSNAPLAEHTFDDAVRLTHPDLAEDAKADSSNGFVKAKTALLAIYKIFRIVFG